MPQSMQRAPCWRSLSSDTLPSSSRQSLSRSSTGRRAGISLPISRNPVILPIMTVLTYSLLPIGERLRAFAKRRRGGEGESSRLLPTPPRPVPLPKGEGMVVDAAHHHLDRRQLGRVAVEMLRRKHLAVFDRHHPDELRGDLLPSRKHAPGELALRQVVVPADQIV